MNKSLLAVLGILVILFAVSLVVEFQKKDTVSDFEIVDIGTDELLCGRDSDCTLANPMCCQGCNYGVAMNLKTAERIEKDRAYKCKSANCPVYDCYLNSCGEGKTEPRASCVNNKCFKNSSDIDCNNVCTSMAMSRGEIEQLGCSPYKNSFESLYGVCRCGN